MVESFVQLKKKAVSKSVLYSLLLGLCAAAFCFGGVFLVIKRTIVEFPVWGYALVAGGVFVAAGGVSLLFSYPTVKKFAKRLDEEYALGEKVQTMVEFDGQEGDVLTLQRQQTEEILRSLPPKKKGVWFYLRIIVAPVLAVAMTVTSLLVPFKWIPKPIPDDDKIYESGFYQIKDLETLIKNVEGSTLTDTLKPAYVATLNDLLNLLNTDVATVGQVRTAVRRSMTLVQSLTKQANSYNAFARAMGEVSEWQSLANALKESGVAYKQVEGVNLNGYATLVGKEQAIYDVVKGKISAYAAGVQTEIDGLTEKEAYLDYANAWVERMEALLLADAIVNLPDGDEIRIRLTALKTAIAGTVSTLTTDGTATVTAQKGIASEALSNFVADRQESNGVAVAMQTQAHSYMMKDYVLQTLSRLFDVAIPEEEGGGNGGGSNEGESGSGGGGSGGLDNADGGLVYDAFTDTYKPYGQALSEYYALVRQLLAEDASGEGKIPDELRAYLEEYFSYLQSNDE